MPRSLLVLLCCVASTAAQEPAFKPLLAKPILPAAQTFTEAQAFIASRLLPPPKATTQAEWEKEAKRLRDEMFAKVVFRGEAAKWRDAKAKVEWLDTLPGGDGYQIKQLRFEAVPGLWVPAVLYEPTKLKGKVPATLNVMGHDGGGKDVAYQQIRCINLAKRGMLALNGEWFAFGQLAGPGFRHGTMNQLDLCGTSGLAPFYLSLKRGLDVLLEHPHADPARVAVSGLSGGGWQTIYISALDPRVTLTNPVAGYSSFHTRIKHWKDLGDSEQTPCDMATVADYDHLTALLAPRAALLTYNAKDECCFEAGYVLPRLYDVSLPFFNLYKRGDALRTHTNHVPGTHNYEKENREAFYRMIGDHFFAGVKDYSADEMACDKEIKRAKELAVPLPKNLDFNQLALALAKDLPRDARPPTGEEALVAWRKKRRSELEEVVKHKRHAVKAAMESTEKQGAVNVVRWRLELGKDWTVPVVELAPAKAKGTALLVCDDGRASTAAAREIDRLLAKGMRVLAVDPFYFGECRIKERAYLWALLIGAVGERPLGVQVSQLLAVASWSEKTHGTPLELHAIGPRTSLIALVAATAETDAIASVALTDSLGSLKEILERNVSYDQAPEQFCFGLLEKFDIPVLSSLVAPRPVGAWDERAEPEALASAPSRGPVRRGRNVPSVREAE